MHDETTTPELLTTQEVAAVLRVHTSTVSRYVQQRELTAVRTGSKLLVPRASLDEFIERHTQHAAPQQPRAPRTPRPVSVDRERLREEFPHLADRAALRSA